jgi:putative spermidine/putrescine transport system ATP-binding protein
MIRPEDIRVVAPQQASLIGNVSAVSFVGDRQRLAITGAATRTLIADVPNSITVKAGDRVGLAVEPASVRPLPKEGA